MHHQGPNVVPASLARFSKNLSLPHCLVVAAAPALRHLRSQPLGPALACVDRTRGPLSLAAMVKRKPPTRQERRQVRHHLSSLLTLALPPSCRVRYPKAMRLFFTWVLQHEICLPETNAEFDDVVCKFVESCWEEGESKNVIGDFLSALPKYSPHLNRKLSCSWSLYRTWQRHEPPFRCPPFTLQVCMAVAGFMWQKGFRCAAAATLLGFHCILRSGEMLDAKWCNLALSDDMGTLLLPRTKSGTRFGYPESVVIHDRTLLRLLRRLQLVSPNHGSVAGIVPSHYRRLSLKPCNR